MDIEQLIAPIKGDNPVGIYLKSDRARFRVARNAFNAAQSAFRRLIETPESSQDEELVKENNKNWQALDDCCSEILASQSKDIEIACWWIASQAFTATPIQSLTTALTGLNQLISQYWPDIHPYTPDEKLKGNTDEAKTEDRVAIQLRPFVQLLGESESSGLLYMPLQLTPLISDIDHATFLSAKKNGTLSEVKQNALKSFTADKVQIERQILNLGELLDSLNQLDSFISQQCQSYKTPAISCSFLRNSLTNCLEAIRYLVGEQFSRWPLDPEPVATTTENSAAPTSTIQNNAQSHDHEEQPSSPSNENATLPPHIRNRDQAFQQMRIIADYFKQQEPHSPISFMIEKTIRWGYLPFPALMEELVRGNKDVIQQIGLLTGMNEDGTTPIPESLAPTTQALSTPLAASASEPDTAETSEKITIQQNNSSTDDSGGSSTTSLTSDFEW